MTKTADILLRKTAIQLAGKRCSHVRFGGTAGTSFHLSLGKMVRINPPVLKSPLLRRLAAKETAAERNFKPEFGLLVWCSWRLSTKERLLASSQGRTKRDLGGLSRLNGLRITKVEVGPGFRDLGVRFAKGLRLDIFCDKGRLAPTADPDAAEGANWDIFGPDNFIVGA